MERREKVRKRPVLLPFFCKTNQSSKENQEECFYRADLIRTSSKPYYPCKNELKGPSFRKLCLTGSVLSGDIMSQRSSDKELTMLQVHPFLTPNTDCKRQEGNGRNFSEISNKLSYSRQMEKSGEINGTIFHPTTLLNQSTG